MQTSQQNIFFFRFFAVLACILFLKIFHISAFFIAFAAILFAIGLHTTIHLLQRKLSLSYTYAYVLVCMGLFLVIFGIIWFFSASIFSQADELSRELPLAYEKLSEQYENIPWLQRIGASMRTYFEENGGNFGITTATGILTTVGSLLAILIISLYLAIKPEMYKKGVLYLFPEKKQKNIDQFFKQSYRALQKWLMGKLLAMCIIAGAIGLGLLILGVNLAFILALLAGLLSFIPNFGPLISAVPAVLLGLTESTNTGLLVIGLFLVVQFLESYLLLPLIYQKEVHLPPALTLFFQILFGALFGIWGIALAAPLAVVSLVAAKVFK